MSRRPKNIKRKKEFYTFALKILRKGFDDGTGKRGGQLFDGFESRDGYDLRNVDEWTPAQKARITRAFTAVDQLASRPHKIVRPRNKKNLERLQEASQHRHKIKGLKVAFVPVADPDSDIKIKYKKTAVVIKEGRVGKFFIEFDIEKLILDPATEINEKVKANPAKVYNVSAGEHFINTPLYTPEQIEEEVSRLQNKYDAQKHDPNDSNSSYWENWLNGIIGYNYETRADGLGYREARRTYKDIFKDKRAKHRRKVRGMIKTKRKKRRGI